jgi:hypothetical protein
VQFWNRRVTPARRRFAMKLVILRFVLALVLAMPIATLAVW